MGEWAGIVRVSHMGSRREDAPNFHSAREQTEAIENAVPAGDRLVMLTPELNVSGGRPLEERPSLLEAVEGVEAGRYAGIIVAYQSRLARDMEYEETVWRRIEAAGGMVIMALDGIDTSTVDGKMLRRIRSVFNHGEREKHAERFARTRKFATAAGVWQRRQIPRGYAKDPETRRLTPGPDRADIPAAHLSLQRGASIASVAADLGMTAPGAAALLRNRLYLGELRVGDDVNLNAHEPLITPATYEATQAALDRRTRPARAPGRDAPALLAGLIRCAGCGHAMSRGSGRYENYRCRRLHSQGACERVASVACSTIDAHVVELVMPLVERLTVDEAVAHADVDNAREQVRAAEAELAAFLDATSAVAEGHEAFADAARARTRSVEDARQALRAALRVRPLMPRLKSGPEAWEIMDDHERGQLLRGLLEGVVVRAVGRGKRVPIAERARVILIGADILPVSRSTSMGVSPVWPDADDVHVLRPTAVEDAS